jgi:hypothetical protein
MTLVCHGSVTERRRGAENYGWGEVGSAFSSEGVRVANKAGGFGRRANKMRVSERAAPLDRRCALQPPDSAGSGAQLVKSLDAVSEIRAFGSANGRIAANGDVAGPSHTGWLAGQPVWMSG